MAVLMLDLDDVKPINDHFGHAAGDFVLKIVAERLRHQVRNNTHCARFGGDEFLVICEDIGGAAQQAWPSVSSTDRDCSLIFPARQPYP